MVEAGWCTPPSWDTKLWCTHNQAEISRKKIKFGDLPRWVRSCLKQEPRQSWKFPLRSCEPSDLVPCEQTKSWRVLEPWECEVEKWRWATEKWFPDIRNRGKGVFEGDLQIRNIIWGHKINHSRDSSVLLMNPPLFGRPRFKGSDVSNEKLLLLRALLHLVWHASWHGVLCNANGIHSSKKPTWIGLACSKWAAALIYYVT